jgi:hypothetical protein
MFLPTLTGCNRIPPLNFPVGSVAWAVTTAPKLTASACNVIVGEKVPSELSGFSNLLVIEAVFANIPSGVVAVKEIAPSEFTVPSTVTAVVPVPVISPPAVKVPAAPVTNAPPEAVAVSAVAADTAPPIATVVAPLKATDPSMLVMEPIEVPVAMPNPSVRVVREIFPGADAFPVTLTSPVTSSAVALLKKRPLDVAVEAATTDAPESSATEVVSGAVKVPTEPALTIDRAPVPPMGPMVISVPSKELFTDPVPTFRVKVLPVVSFIPPLKVTGLEAPRKVKL